MRNRMYGGVRGRKTKVGRKLLHFPPTRFGKVWSLAAVVADDLVDLDDDVFGDAELYGSAINHLREVDALLVWLSDRYLAEYFFIR